MYFTAAVNISCDPWLLGGKNGKIFMKIVREKRQLQATGTDTLKGQKSGIRPHLPSATSRYFTGFLWPVQKHWTIVSKHRCFAVFWASHWLRVGWQLRTKARERRAHGNTRMRQMKDEKRTQVSNQWRHFALKQSRVSKTEQTVAYHLELKLHGSRLLKA